MPRTRVSVTPVSVAVPGRVRLSVEGLRGSRELVALIEERLVAHPDVHRVQASPVTGTVLILFEPRRVRLRDLIARLRQWAAEGPSRSLTPDTSSADRPPAARGVSAPSWARQQPWHAMRSGSVMRALQASPITGLSHAEVPGRLAWVGANRVPPPTPKPTWRILVDQVTSMPVVLLGVAAGLSLVTGGLADAAVILAVVVLNTGIGWFMEHRAGQTIAALTRLGPPEARARRDGRELVLPAANLVPGDVLVLRSGDLVPADARLLTLDGLVVNEAALTGESHPVSKRILPVRAIGTALAERKNMVYAGTVVTEGSGLAMVTATGRATEVGRIRALVGEAVPPPTPLVRELEGMSRRLVTLCLACSGVALGLGVLRGVPLLEMLRTAIALAVAAVPEGLPTVATTTLALGMQRMRRRGVLIRTLEAVEGLGAVTVICVDKTGTLTENRMAVHEWHVGGRSLRPSAADPLDRSPVDGGLAAPDVTPDTFRRALEIAVLCNEAELERAGPRATHGAHGSATELALLRAGQAVGLDYRAIRRQFARRLLKPRRANQYWMGTVHDAAPGRRLIAVKGAPEAVFRLSSEWHDGLGVRPLTPGARRELAAANASMAQRGMRVLGLAYKELGATEVPTFEDLVWVGLVGLTDPVRPGVREAIAACHRAGIRVVMLTGDQPLTALAVARELQLCAGRDAQVFDASRLTTVDGRILASRARTADVFARVSPVHKYEIVRALQEAGDVVAMTGDGINDAPALRVADLGIAMGAAGTVLAREVADVVLADDTFPTILEAIAQGRTIYANTGKAVRFLLSTNGSEILVTLAALAGGVARPLSAIQFLWINLLSDVLPALALAAEPADPTVMAQPPRDPAQPMLSGEELQRIAKDAALLSAATLAAYGGAILRYGVGARSSTVAFSTLTGTQLLHALTCRSERDSGLSGLHANPAMLGALSGTLGLAIAAVMTPALRRLLQTTALSGFDGGGVTAAALMPLLFHELRKFRRGADVLVNSRIDRRKATPVGGLPRAAAHTAPQSTAIPPVRSGRTTPAAAARRLARAQGQLILLPRPPTA